jgi:hypothetical protein
MSHGIICEANFVSINQLSDVSKFKLSGLVEVKLNTLDSGSRISDTGLTIVDCERRRADIAALV